MPKLNQRRIARTVGRVLLIGFALIGMLVAVVTLTPLVSIWANLYSPEWNAPRGRTLIVLGGSHLGIELPGDSTYWRGIYAVQVWQQGNFDKVLLCGRETGGPMRSLLLAGGVPAAAIVVEDQSANTRENALFARKVTDRLGLPEPYLLLTSDYHMFRAQRVFEHAGLPVIPCPIPDARKRGASYFGRWPAFLDLVAETAKIAVYQGRGWLGRPR